MANDNRRRRPPDRGTTGTPGTAAAARWRSSVLMVVTSGRALAAKRAVGGSIPSPRTFNMDEAEQKRLFPKVGLVPGDWLKVEFGNDAVLDRKEFAETLAAAVRAGIMSPADAVAKLKVGENMATELYFTTTGAVTIPSGWFPYYKPADDLTPRRHPRPEPEPFKLSPNVAFVDDARIERTIKDGRRVFRGRFSTLFVMRGCNTSPSDEELHRFCKQLTRGYHAIREVKKLAHMWRRVVVNEKARRQVVELGVTEIGVGSARWIDIVNNLRK